MVLPSDTIFVPQRVRVEREFCFYSMNLKIKKVRRKSGWVYEKGNA